MKMLLLRPYYGITIHSDMHGDLGITDYCPAVFPDLSLVYSASIAKKSNLVELDVIDANAEKLFPLEVNKRLSNNYDLIIIKSSEPTIKYDIEYAKDLKKLFPRAKLIMAGHIVKILKNYLQKKIKEVDEILEIPLEDYIYKFLHKETDDLRINDFPSPDYSLFPYEKYIDYSGVMHASIQMSRGCIGACSYCPYTAFFGRKLDYRTSENIIKDIKGVLNLGINYIQFRDQYFTYNKKNVVALCQQIIEQNLNFNWSCETKIESLNYELINLMVEAGLKKICFGIESASKQTLKAFKRPITNIAKAKRIINYLKGKGVETVAFYIIGFPDDTWESIQSTYELSTNLASTYAKFNIYTPTVTQDVCIDGFDIESTSDVPLPFSIMITKNPSKYLTIEELDYLSNQLAIMYHSSFNSLEEGYKYHYINQNSFMRIVKKLRKVENDITGDIYEQ